MVKADRSLAEVLEFEVPATLVSGHRVGVVVAFDETGVYVDYPGNPHGPLQARSAVLLDAAQLVAAASERRQVLLTFEDERSDLPIVIGFMHVVPRPAPLAAAAPGTTAATLEEAPALSGFQPVVDGNKLVLEAQDEVVLRCGEASITLRRNGKLAIRGVFVETRARMVNRIKGGSVQIN
jgi:hypothetical protein